jgi:hypothetical protein
LTAWRGWAGWSGGVPYSVLESFTEAQWIGDRWDAQGVIASALDVDPAKPEEAAEDALVQVRFLNCPELDFIRAPRKQAALHDETLIRHADFRRPYRDHDGQEGDEASRRCRRGEPG